MIPKSAPVYNRVWPGTGGIRGDLRGLRAIHLAGRVIRRHRNSQDEKGDRQDQGRGRKDKEGPSRKRQDSTERIARP